MLSLSEGRSLTDLSFPRPTRVGAGAGCCVCVCFCARARGQQGVAQTWWSRLVRVCICCVCDRERKTGGEARL